MVLMYFACMPIWVFAVVVISAFFQAWWNFHLKKTPIDRSAFLLMGWVVFGLVSTPISLFFIDKPFQWEWLYFILSTGFAQGIYLLVLCWAYAVSDISLVFPVARGASIVVTAITLYALGANPISTVGWAGIGAIAFGAMSMGSVDLHTARGRTGLFASLLMAMIIASYSVIDSFGAQEIPIVFYVMVMNLTGPLFAFPYVYHRRKADVIVAFKNYKWEGFLVGLAGSLAYIVVISMFQYSSAAYVLALREVSIVFAAVLGIRFLGERRSLRKYVGIGCILLGILLIKMA